MTRHLLHVGYPKAGSTYLQRWFAAHPQLAYTDGAIAGFQSVHAIGRAGAQGGDSALYRVTSAEQLSTPSRDAGIVAADHRAPVDMASQQQRVCDLLADLFPNAVVLIVTRGFRSMILSSYSQFVRAGGDVGLTEMIASATARGPSPGSDRSPWNYDRLIAAYTRRFGAEQVLVMPYELLRDDAHEFTRVLAAKLGIDPIPGTRERVNESLSPLEMHWYPKFARVVRRIPSRRVHRLWVAMAFHNRLRGTIRLLELLRRGVPVTSAMVSDEVLETFRGNADSLRDHPLYRPYAGDYLF